tara:strand:+ start:5493 stop:6242 length:750 start_codon:yes stop_codon:yes gene_type:complete
MFKPKELSRVGGAHWFEDEYPKNITPRQTMIRRTWVQSVSGSHGKACIPYWFPSGLGNRSADGDHVPRKGLQYNRTDLMYQSMLKLLPNANKHGLELRSDIGRSTGFLASVTDKITVLEDAIEWILFYDDQSRNIARRLGKSKECEIEWCYKNNDHDIIGNKRIYDWIKIEFDAMHLIEKALQVIKPGGIIICVGPIEQLNKWHNAKWAKGLSIQHYNASQWGKGKYLKNSTNSYLYFSININTNGETQ